MVFSARVLKSQFYFVLTSQKEETLGVAMGKMWALSVLQVLLHVTSIRYLLSTTKAEFMLIPV